MKFVQRNYFYLKQYLFCHKKRFIEFRIFYIKKFSFSIILSFSGEAFFTAYVWDLSVLAKFKVCFSTEFSEYKLICSEMCRGNNFSWMDPNLQQAAAAAVAFNAAASFNAMQNFPHFDQLGTSVGGLSSFGNSIPLQPNTSSHSTSFGSSESLANNSIQSPQLVQRHGLRSYSQSTASTSHTPQSNGPPSQSQSNALSPQEGHSVT